MPKIVTIHHSSLRLQIFVSVVLLHWWIRSQRRKIYFRLLLCKFSLKIQTSWERPVVQLFSTFFKVVEAWGGFFKHFSGWKTCSRWCDMTLCSNISYWYDKYYSYVLVQWPLAFKKSVPWLEAQIKLTWMPWNVQPLILLVNCIQTLYYPDQIY